MSQDNLSRLLTHIRNASLARQGHVTLPESKASYALARILKENGFIVDFKVGLVPNPSGLTPGSVGGQSHPHTVQGQKTKIRFYRQKQSHRLWKMERKLRVLMRKRQKLKAKLKLSYKLALKRAKHAKRWWPWRRRTRFFKRRRTQARKGVKQRSLTHATLNPDHGTNKSERSLQVKPLSGTQAGLLRSKTSKPVKLGRLNPAPRKRKGSPLDKWIAKSPRFISKRKKIRSRPYGYMRKQKTKLHRLFKRQRPLQRGILKSPHVYLQALKLNRGLCFHLQKKRAELKARIGRPQGQTQAGQPTVQRKQIHLRLKYFGPYRRPAITQIKRVSRPSLRRTSNFRRIERVHLGMGLTILSTSQGMMSHLQAQRQKVGGEIIASIW